jgi:hypothetical protein
LIYNISININKLYIYTTITPGRTDGPNSKPAPGPILLVHWLNRTDWHRAGTDPNRSTGPRAKLSSLLLSPIILSPMLQVACTVCFYSLLFELRRNCMSIDRELGTTQLWSLENKFDFMLYDSYHEETFLHGRCNRN